MSKQARRDVILNAATGLFFERGYGGVSVDEIGEAAGMSGPTLYRYFPNKAAILAEIIDRTLDRSLERMAVFEPGGLEDLTAKIRLHIELVLDDPQMTCVWLREARSLPPEHNLRRIRRERTYIDHFVRSIHRVREDLSAERVMTLALALLGTLNAIATWPKEARDAKHVLDDVTRFALDGLGLSPAAPQ